MTDQEKADFDFLTTHLVRLASTTGNMQTSPLATGCVVKLEAWAADKFPDIYVIATKVKAQIAIAQTTKHQSVDAMAILGPQMWEKLHQRLPVTDVQAEMKWLSDWAAQLPPSCDCKSSLANFLRANPPDFVNYFAWTVKLHNAVNAKLNKPQLTEEQARAIWTK